MSISSQSETSLLHIYQRARALAADQEARPGEARALSTAFAEFSASREGTSGADQSARGLPERVRRAIIAALRRQALAARDAWLSRAGGDALEAAIALAEDALRLHRQDDTGRAETEYILRFLRATAAVAAAPARRPVAQPAAGGAAPGITAPAAPEAAPRTTSEVKLPAVSEVTPPPPAAPPPGPAVPAAEVKTVAPAAAAPAPGPASPERGGAAEETPPAGAVGSTEPAVPATPTEVVVFPAPGSVPEAAPPPWRPVHPVAAETPRRPVARARGRPTVVVILAVMAVVGFIAGVVSAPRLLSSRRAGTPPPVVVAPPAAVSPAVPPAGAVPAPPAASPARVAPPSAAPPVPAAPAAGVASPQTAPAQSPKAATSGQPAASPAPAKVTVLLRSEPSGARVYVAGVLRGTTPLRLESTPGTVIRVTVRRDDRIWRGTLRIGQVTGQTVTVRLPVPPVPVAQPAPTRAPAPVAPQAVDRRAHYESLLVQGVELYRAGWYGPAAARFRQATTVLPGSPRAYLWLARASYRAGRYGEAREALEKVIALAPGSESAREAQKLLNLLKHLEKGA